MKTTDTEIRKFMQASRPVPDGSGKFMKDFVRQSALLPQPSSLAEKEDLEKAERLQSLYRMAELIRKANRVDAAAASASAIAVCLLCFIIVMSAAAIFPLP